jgi:exodeoxyribonuclease-1
MNANYADYNDNQPSFFWYDYETWGANPKCDPACQFAGIRTDLNFNIIGDPVNLFSQIPNDYLPHPQAVLVTGITPQYSLQHGLLEHEFVSKVHEHLASPNTCIVGYNNIRFDDEVSRFTFYRNFFDPYAHEWQMGNSRWDMIDLVRACYALRPEGVNWPERDDGSPSFKLTDLTKANQLDHQQAHDALSDVYATVALAKLIKEKQPRLFDYVFSHRSKRKVSELISVSTIAPFLHISSKLPALQGCATWMVALAHHPTNKNALICLNLQLDPQPLMDLKPEELVEKLYRPSNLMAPDEQRLPIKLIHINKCPVVLPAKSLTEDNAMRLGIDRAICLKHLRFIQSNSEQLNEILTALYQIDSNNQPKLDVEQALYQGFFCQSDKTIIESIRHASPQALSITDFKFEDERLNTLLFRYRARNFPESLSEEESMRWLAHRRSKLFDQDDQGKFPLDSYFHQLEQLTHEHEQDPNKMKLLKALYYYGQYLSSN